MQILIILAFANFFFIMNKNTFKNDEHLVPDYVGDDFTDAVIQMYRLALGEFDDDGFAGAFASPLIYVFFILATFIILIVFMNMLIAIMSNTFEEVQAVQEESKFKE